MVSSCSPRSTIQELAPELVESTASLLSGISVTFAGLSTIAMTRAICRYAVTHPDLLVLVAVDRGSAVGAIVTTLEPRRFWRRFLLRRPLLSVRVVVRRLCSHFSRMQAAEAIRRPARDADSILAGGVDVPLVEPGAHAWYDPPPHTAKILFIGVSPSHRRSGLGKALYQQLISSLEGRGVARVYARVGYDNVASLHLHHRTGWRLYNEPESVLAVLPID